MTDEARGAYLVMVRELPKGVEPPKVAAFALLAQDGDHAADKVLKRNPGAALLGVSSCSVAERLGLRSVEVLLLSAKL